MRWKAAGERVLLTLWVGSLWTAGYVVAPLLFAQLGEPRLAGALAGAMFTVVAHIGLACGSVLTLVQWLQRPSLRNWRAWVMLIMVVLIGAGEFGIRRYMVPGAPDFGRLHGIAQSIFLVVSLLGLVLVAAGLRARRE